MQKKTIDKINKKLLNRSNLTKLLIIALFLLIGINFYFIYQYKLLKNVILQTENSQLLKNYPSAYPTLTHVHSAYYSLPYSSDGWLTYENGTNNYSFQYPDELNIAIIREREDGWYNFYQSKIDAQLDEQCMRKVFAQTGSCPSDLMGKDVLSIRINKNDRDDYKTLTQLKDIKSEIGLTQYYDRQDRKWTIEDSGWGEAVSIRAETKIGSDYYLFTIYGLHGFDRLLNKVLIPETETGWNATPMSVELLALTKEILSTFTVSN